jgi:hypothetical protein
VDERTRKRSRTEVPDVFMKRSDEIRFASITKKGVFLILGCPSTSPDNPGTPVDETPPTVISTSPIDNATGIAVNGIITATFSEAMTPATITAAHFTLNQNAILIPGIVTYEVATKTVTFAPTSNLTGGGTVYTATITTGVKDLAGIPLMMNKVRETFATTSPGSCTRPIWRRLPRVT